jgi:hypothetical protein
MVLIRGVCVVGVQEERGEAHPPPRREQQPGLHATMVRHLDLLISVLCRQSCDFSFCCWCCCLLRLIHCSEEAAFGDFNDWEDEVYEGHKVVNLILFFLALSVLLCLVWSVVTVCYKFCSICVVVWIVHDPWRNGTGEFCISLIVFVQRIMAFGSVCYASAKLRDSGQ